MHHLHPFIAIVTPQSAITSSTPLTSGTLHIHIPLRQPQNDLLSRRIRIRIRIRILRTLHSLRIRLRHRNGRRVRTTWCLLALWGSPTPDR